LLLAVGCTDAANTQYLPIGSRCSSNGQCGTAPFDCATAYPGGYCEHSCATDCDCPKVSFCVTPSGATATMRACRRRCSATPECRAAEGYLCVPLSGTVSVCDWNGGPVDGGLP
jgi:hypothetical protein